MRVLLITPNFFDYPSQICDELRLLGHEVDWFDDRPSTNSLVKAAIRVKKDTVKLLTAKYFEKVMETVRQKKYDKVLLISGQSLSFSEEMMAELKASQNQAEFILYQWDAVKNFPYITRLQHLFERCYSFDKTDVAAYGNLTFLPLFYSRRYEEIGAKPRAEFKYDSMFVGTAHPKKYQFIKEMSAKLSDVYKKQFIYFFFPSRIVYIYRKFKNPELKNAKYSEFNFTPVSGRQMDKLLTDSRCVLDSAQDGQIGLTIRVLEALGAKRKIITTNEDAVNYDFYREENVYIYDGQFDFNSKFFMAPYQELPENIYKKYSLRSWLTTLLG